MTNGPPDPIPRGSPVNGIHPVVLRRIVVVHDPQGLHMRPAAMFAKIARQYQSVVTIHRGDRSVNGKSQLDLLLLAAEPGAELTIEVMGTDANDALTALGSVFDIANWDEDETEAVPPKG
ncbi:MAG: HPr family phosphocarrier protein [Gemmataceae bacterium]